MSRQIDLSEGYEVLSQDDLTYLDARNQLPSEYRHLLESVGGTPSSNSSQPDPEPEDDEDEVPPYPQWSKAELHEELDKRGVQYAKKDTIAELAALLEADDAEAEG